MMKNFFGYAAAVAAMAAISLLLAAVPPTLVKAQSPPPPPSPTPNCSVSELSECTIPFAFGSTPTPTCCAKLKQQQPCFCVYLKDPSLAQYVNSSNARKIAASCNVTYPTNCP
ncbi:non-specific lipid-transfer protein 2 [Arachis duranensis]|uniref:Non-specific lipid-transfer protein 2 n=1 Tax=Arachis duranensis TaxID=130453 RepID=A0A6P4DCV5_ARADU|nr:non-specific lipid-transfer protein 2 [Arachis duranensis]